MARIRDDDGRILPIVKAILIGIPVIVSAVGLVFTLRPSLKPCLGASSAEFTGVPVFPHVRYRDHLVRQGMPKEVAAKEPNLLGAEVRFSYRIQDLRGEKLPLRWTLVTVQRDGTVGSVVRGEDRAFAQYVTPDACSASGGKTLFVLIPDRRKRYRVVLELFRDARLQDRLALDQTTVFSG